MYQEEAIWDRKVVHWLELTRTNSLQELEMAVEYMHIY